MNISNPESLNERGDLHRILWILSVRHDHGTTADQGQKDFRYPDIEADGGTMKRPVIRAEFNEIAGIQQSVQNLTMLHHHSLGAAGGS